MTKLVVTRHANLIKYLKELGLIDDTTKIIPHAKERDLIGKEVFGVLPHWLSCFAERYTEVQIRIPKELRDTELSLKDIRIYSCDPRTYIVEDITEC